VEEEEEAGGLTLSACGAVAEAGGGAVEGDGGRRPDCTVSSERPWELREIARRRQAKQREGRSGGDGERRRRRGEDVERGRLRGSVTLPMGDLV